MLGQGSGRAKHTKKLGVQSISCFRFPIVSRCAFLFFMHILSICHGFPTVLWIFLLLFLIQCCEKCHGWRCFMTRAPTRPHSLTTTTANVFVWRFKTSKAPSSLRQRWSHELFAETAMSQTRADTDTAVEDEAVATPQANANTFAQSLFLDHRYTRQEASLLWRDHEHLLTIGSSGVRDSHRNSTHDLTNGHNFVKIKVATDKLNATAIALEIVSDERLQKKIHIVEVRPKGFLVARNDPLAAKKTVPARDKSLDSQAPTSQKRSSSSKLTQNRDKKFAFPTRGFKKIKSGFSDTLTSGKGTAKMLRKTTVVNPPRSGRKPRPGR